MANNQQNIVTIDSNKLLQPFSTSNGAITLINNGITNGYVDATVIKNKFDMTNATFSTQNDLEVALKDVILSSIVKSSISTGSISCGYLSTDYSEHVVLDSGVYYLSENTISNNTNKYVAYTTYLDIIDAMVDSIATFILNYGFTHNTIILQTTPIVTTTTLGGNPQILAIDLSTVTGILGNYGGSFIHDVFNGASIDEEGIVKPSLDWEYASSTNSKLTLITTILAYIYESVNRVEFVESLNTTQLLNAIKNENLPLPSKPTSGSWGWNYTITEPLPQNPYT